MNEDTMSEKEQEDIVANYRFFLENTINIDARLDPSINFQLGLLLEKIRYLETSLSYLHQRFIDFTINGKD
jgi:pyoverdine/dityrosine biosynthesis protein Dit1